MFSFMEAEHSKCAVAREYAFKPVGCEGSAVEMNAKHTVTLRGRQRAAAYAEIGGFENAVKWQQKALELSSPSERQERCFLLELYKSGQPFRNERRGFRLGNVDRT
jgi:hypothetical protein